jgi:hypothetical protein
MNEGKDMIKLNIDKNAPKVADTNQLMKQMSRIKGDELIKSAYTIDPSIKKGYFFNYSLKIFFQ